MKSSRPEGVRTVGIVLIAVSFLFFAILVIFLAMRRGEQHEKVTLPDTAASQVQPDDKTESQQLFVTLTPQNVGDAVATLARPRYYYEVCTLRRYWEEQQTTETVERWVSGERTKIVVSGASGTKTFLSDRETVYLWYGDGAEGVSTLRLAGTTLDDLAGVPSYESIVGAPETEIRKVSYVDLSADASCIFVEFAPDESGYYDQMWVNLSTGTLYKANSCVQESLIYQMQQDALTVYAANDAALEDVFVLPDGSSPFSATE